MNLLWDFKLDITVLIIEVIWEKMHLNNSFFVNKRAKWMRKRMHIMKMNENIQFA